MGVLSISLHDIGSFVKVSPAQDTFVLAMWRGP